MLTEINLLNNDFYSNFTRCIVMGVSERKGDRSVTAVLERKSFAKRPFRSHFVQ